MNFYLLDAGGAALLLFIPIAFVFLLLVWGLVEGFVINLYGINRFWRSVWHAIIVNLLSLVVGFIMIGVAHSMDLSEYTSVRASTELLPSWIIFWLVSVVVEALVLKALNRSKPWGKIFSASFVMNIITYIIMFAFVYYQKW